MPSNSIPWESLLRQPWRSIKCAFYDAWVGGRNLCIPTLNTFVRQFNRADQVKDHQLQMDRKQHEVRELAAENAKLNQDYTVLNKRLKCAQGAPTLGPIWRMCHQVHAAACGCCEYPGKRLLNGTGFSCHKT
eukprot:1160100-Pelagomonas_calceolata.AAC.7